MKIIRNVIIILALLLAVSAEAAERVVVTFPQSFGLIYIMGLSNKIVGMPTQKLHIKNGNLSPFYQHYSPNLASATDIGFTGAVNMETLLSLNPDLVISSANIASSQENAKFLRSKGIKVLEIMGGSGSVKNWLDMVKRSCDEAGVPERAETYINLWQKNLAFVNERLAKIPTDKRVKATLINSNGGEITVRGSRSKFCIDLIKHAGGIVMDGDKDPKDSAACAELVFKFDPDVIIDDYSNTGNCPEWIEHLRAVKNGRVYPIPYDDKDAWITIWTFNAYSPLGLLWLAKNFYPEEFADLNLDKAQDEFCVTVFGSNFKKK
ncbi:MAG: ABC transporter substrate-binding protein [Candidatus Riflebacteria bacterium]|nr:ABC transporter substrate-binding protein [Candidatus Riflebacteria bacterium]